MPYTPRVDRHGGGKRFFSHDRAQTFLLSQPAQSMVDGHGIPVGLEEGWFWENLAKSGERPNPGERPPYILSPLHHPEVSPRGHWSLVMVRTETCEIQAFDSLLHPRHEELVIVRNFVQALARQEGNPALTEGWNLHPADPSCPRQPDAESCGAMICA